MELQTVISLRDLTKKIGKKTIVDHLSFDIHQGEVFGFLGPNGAGKTTTIRMMVGLISISEGQVLIHGKNIRTDFKNAIANVGCIVENPEMYKYLTGYQNLKHMARMAKVDAGNRIDEKRISEVVDLVGLGKRIHDKVSKYSLGMRQRLGVAQALLHRPSILILDEPTNGLDPAGIRELRDQLRYLAKEEKMAVIVSSHLLSEMELMCDRVAIIAQGKLVQVQTVGQMIDSEQEQQVMSIEVNDVGEALTIIQKTCDANATQHVDVKNTIQFTATKEQVATVIEALVKQEIRVYRVDAQRKTLEDRFLEITGGGEIA